MRAWILPGPERLGPLGEEMALSLLPLFGRPFLEHVLEQLPCGATLFAYRHPDQLEEHFGARLKVHPVKHCDPEKILALRRPETVLVLWEGTLVLADWEEALKVHREGAFPRTRILAPGGEAVATLLEPEATLDGPSQTVLARGYGDVRTPQGYLDLHREALLGRLPLFIPGQERAGVRIEAGARLSPKAILRGTTWISKESRVGPECRLEDSCLEGACRLSRGAQLKGCLALGRTRVGKATTFHDTLLFHRWIIGHRVEGAEPDLLREWGWHGFAPDALLAALLLVLLSPLMLFLALLILVDSPGPVFYSQLRVGQAPRKARRTNPHGRVFDLFKFRTMRIDADRSVPQGAGIFQKPARDPRITRVGHFLRKTSLDELPQLVNVIRGDIRLVGNRPLPVYEAEQLSQSWQLVRFEAPAGITGLWQTSGRSDLSETERLALDSYYALHRTFWGDLWLLVRTIPVLLTHRGAR